MRSRLNSHLHPALQASGFVSLYAVSTLFSGVPEVWAQNATLPVPAANALPDIGNTAQLGLAKFEIEFQDIPVTELLIAIAKQGGVEISIQGDVNGTLKFVHYKSVTAEEAIERVAADAGLYWGRRGNQYIVTKSIDDLPSNLQKKPQGFSQGSRTGGVFDSIAKPINPDEGGNNSITSSSPGGREAAGSGNFIPDLYEKKNAKTKQTSVIRVHNVPPRMMAYWLNPSNHAPDNITANSQRLYDESQDRRTMRPVSPEAFNLVRPAPAMAYPYPYPGQMVSPGMSASPYVIAPNGYRMNSSPYMMGAGRMAPPVQPSAFNFTNPNANNGQRLPSNVQNVPSENGWNTVVTNGWGRPLLNGRGNAVTNARPQFGGGGGQFGGGGGQFGGGGGQFGGGQGGQGGGQQQIQSIFDLPEGIEALAAVDAQNALLIRGTAQAVEELQTLIDLLDQPLKQVEVEAQFVTLNTSYNKAFGINFNSSNGPFSASGSTVDIGGNFVLNYVGRNFSTVLRAALADNRAKLITAPRVVAVNNLTASIFTSQTTTVLIPQAVVNPGNGGGGTTVATASVPFQVQTQIGISVTPTINGDGTITVLMRPQVQQQSPPLVEGGIPDVTSQTVDTVAIVNDGDTIALGGLRDKNVGNIRNRIPILSGIPIIGKLFQSYSKTSRDSDLIIFLTARIVRRLITDEVIPGT